MTDLFQFVLKMGMVIVLAVFAVQATGGMDVLLEKLHAVDAHRQGAGSILSFIPDVHSVWMPMITFIVYVAVNWWASWYPGAEPGGGGYIAQRIFCAKNEKHSLLATLWFNIAHYAIRPWPWIIVALVAVARYQGDPAFAADPESGYIRVLISDLPASLRGLMIAAFAAAYMSTVGTQLNWGASYLVNDFYRPFLIRNKTEKHYVAASQVSTMILMVLSAVVTYFMDSIAGAWSFLIAIGAGTGLVYLLRWFWWRINAWSEVSAMTAALVTSLIAQWKFGLTSQDPLGFAYLVIITMCITTVVWLAVTYCTNPEPKEILLSFYRRVRPSPILWGHIAQEATDVIPTKDGLFNLVDWLSGVAMIYSFLFGTGKIILGETGLGFIFLAAGMVFGGIIYIDMNKRGWESIGT